MADRVVSSPGFDTAVFDYEGHEARLESLALTYGTNEPFPHAVLDHFLADPIAAVAARQFPFEASGRWTRYRHVNENKASTDRWEDFPPLIATVVREMNSPRFLAFLRRLTGIEGLVADPDIEGGGMHQAWRGGFLNVHTDFTMHRVKPRWRRRCNLILYLNEGWDPAWGGGLEFWDSRMEHAAKKVDCLLNRAVIFDTPGAMHGFPDWLTCPDDQSRKSLQWYYYTVDDAEPAPGVATTYYARPTESRFKHLAVGLDNRALRAYAWAKRRFGLSDRLVSLLMALVSPGKRRRGR